MADKALKTRYEGIVGVPVAAVVLAGGRSRRMGGQDKLAMPLGNLPLLEHALGAVADASPKVVVGPIRSTERDVIWAQEDPVGGGPVAGIAAGISALAAHGVTTGLVVLLAGDMPFAYPGVSHLVRVAMGNECDAAIATDPQGVDQPLLAVWRIQSLRVALDVAGVADGMPARALLSQAHLIRVAVTPRAIRDCDAPEDLERLARLIDTNPPS